MHSRLKPVVGLVLAVGIGGAAYAQSPFDKPEKAIKYRQSAMFILAQHFGRIGNVVKGKSPYDKDAVAKDAAIAAQMSRLPWEAFGPGTDKMESDAKPEIWTNAAKFKSAAQDMEKQLAQLAELAKGGDLNAIKAQFGATGKACKACHDDFKHR